MPIVVHATYENGVLKPSAPLPLREHETVQIEVTVRQSATAEDAVNAVRRGYGLLRWTGDVETLRQVAESPEFDPLESA